MILNFVFQNFEIFYWSLETSFETKIQSCFNECDIIKKNISKKCTNNKKDFQFHFKSAFSWTIHKYSYANMFRTMLRKICQAILKCFQTYQKVWKLSDKILRIFFPILNKIEDLESIKDSKTIEILFPFLFQFQNHCLYFIILDIIQIIHIFIIMLLWGICRSSSVNKVTLYIFPVFS